MRKRQWSRCCSQKKRRKRKLCLDGLYFLYLFCAFLCPRENWSAFGKCFRKNGGDDGTRTRGLCRDRATFLR